MMKINNLHSNESSQNNSAPPVNYVHTFYEEPDHLGRYYKAYACVGTLEQITKQRKRTVNTLMREAILPHQRCDGFGTTTALLGKTNFPRQRTYTLKKIRKGGVSIFDESLLAARAEYWIHYLNAGYWLHCLNNGMMISKERWEDSFLQRHSLLSPAE